MATVAGIASLYSTSLDGITFNSLTLATDVKPGGQKNDMLDRTTYGQGDAQKRRSKGLHDNTLTLKCDYDNANARITELVSAGDAGSAIWVKCLHNGTNGFSQQCIVDHYDISPPINGKVEITFSLMANGPRTNY
jgi:hypothetical protein